MSYSTDKTLLVQEAQTGDPVAIERLLLVCQIDARRYARKYCKISDVDDAVQEALITVTRKVKTLKVAAAFSSWLFMVIKRECRRLERLMFRQVPLEDEQAEQQLAARSDSVLKMDLIKALDSLPPHYLEVVLLRDFEELTVSEISVRLSESVGTVKSRLHRAREMVREYMLGPDERSKDLVL
ncbi:MAG: RNA polymerase sigma factor [Methylocystaceae bacterium]|nr:RNA polymerase sigma factor [Methylocystaceae bacterium]